MIYDQFIFYATATVTDGSYMKYFQIDCTLAKAKGKSKKKIIVIIKNIYFYSLKTNIV